MSADQISTLLEMGFSKDKAERALQITGNDSVEAAMEWLLAHGSDMDSETNSATLSLNPNVNECNSNEVIKQSDAREEVKKAEGEVKEVEEEGKEEEENVDKSESSQSAKGAQAKSLKCNECGKLFKDQAQVEYHAVKSGHSNFAESTEEKKPLTEEEKQEQLRKIDEKLKQKRVEREQRERAEELEREKTRIRSGKELGEYRKKAEEQEMKKLVEERRREKVEEQRARDRVRAQIEDDRRARKAREAAALGKPVPEEKKASPVLTPTTSAPAVHKDYSQTRLQIRLTNGQALTQTFGSKEQLSAVRLYVEMNRTDGNCPFNLMTSFPKKVFMGEDYEKPLDILGLVPSSVLIVCKDSPH